MDWRAENALDQSFCFSSIFPIISLFFFSLPNCPISYYFLLKDATPRAIIVKCDGRRVNHRCRCRCSYCSPMRYQAPSDISSVWSPVSVSQSHARNKLSQVKFICTSVLVISNQLWPIFLNHAVTFHLSHIHFDRLKTRTHPLFNQIWLTECILWDFNINLYFILRILNTRW